LTSRQIEVKKESVLRGEIIMALGLKGRVAVATGTTHVMEEEPEHTS